MGSFHHPAASAVAGLGSFRLGFFSPLLDMRLVTMVSGSFLRRLSLVAGVGTEMLPLPPSGRWSGSHHARQRRHQ
jgi:hypothetical protein